MYRKKTKRFVLMIIVLLIFIYGILIPIVPLGKFLFSEAKVIRLYPHNLYLLKYLPNEENPNFREYMKNNGWTYSEEMESGRIYKKGALKKYIHVDNFISVNIYDSHIKIWQGMTSLFNYSTFTFYIIFLVYILPALGFVIFITKLKFKN